MASKVNLQIKENSDLLNLSLFNAYSSLNRIVNLLNLFLVFPQDNPIILPMFSEEIKG